MVKLSGIISKLKNIKHAEIVACCAILAVVCVVYFSCVSCSDGKTGLTSVDADVSGSDYCSVMQARVQNAISKIAGVGDATVVINWDKSVSASYLGTSSDNPHATGALIVCDGGKSTKVQLDVIYAVSTLLDLSIEKIIVYPKNR